jgi:hypothetical protein
LRFLQADGGPTKRISEEKQIESARQNEGGDENRPQVAIGDDRPMGIPTVTALSGGNEVAVSSIDNKANNARTKNRRDLCGRAKTDRLRARCEGRTDGDTVMVNV